MASLSLIAVLPLICAVAAIWFWLASAQPVLHRSGNLRAERVGLVVTIVGVLAQFVGIVVSVHREVGTLLWWLWVAGGALWVVVVPIGYPRYEWLLRLTRGNRRGDG